VQVTVRAFEEGAKLKLHNLPHRSTSFWTSEKPPVVLLAYDSVAVDTY
jgi:hypothetical protein